ncbi:hypothetical protein FRC06_007772 [Ceratobasidium sp. 370]|nr:hypothetical protein FRC06_007772 [Ceratobasidium sp. 370]
MARKIGDTHEDAIRWLESSLQPWLLVFDNADDPELNLPNFIPGGSYGSVLITTRLHDLALLGQGPGSDCNVSEMDKEEAVELLLKKARMKGQILSVEEIEAANKLVENLGYLALAIVHAGAYIGCSGSSIAKYTKQCLEHTQVTLEGYGKRPGDTEDIKKTVYATSQMSYERLKPYTKQLLGLMAYLHRDGITEDIFKRAASNTRRALVIPPSKDEAATREYVQAYLEKFLDADRHWDSNEFSMLMDELLLYSLIDYDRVNDAYTLHVLVQDWARTTISHLHVAALKHASHLLALSIDWSNDIVAHAFRRGLPLHVSGLLDNPSAIDANDAAYFARVYEENGRWNDAKPLEVLVLNARKQMLGERHPDTLTSMNNLAVTHSRQGRWDEAEALLVRVLDTMKQTLGARHPDTLTSMNNLATTYSDQGRWSEAETLQVQVFNTMKQTAGERHPDTLVSMNNLATTYSGQGRWVAAGALQVQVLEARRQMLGEHHPDTLTSMNNLATTYSSQGRWGEAEALQVQVLVAQKQTFGERHPDTLTSMNNLAVTYSRHGRWGEAEALQVQVLEAQKQTLGEHYPDTSRSMNNLALTYSRQGRWDEAEALLVRALDARKQMLGERHPDTLTSMNNLAAIYSRQGRWVEAEALQVQAVDGRKRVLGKQHPQTLTAMAGLAFTYRNQGRNRAQKLKVLEEEISELENKS